VEQIQTPEAIETATAMMTQDKSKEVSLLFVI
jgi:hypothetical protein